MIEAKQLGENNAYAIYDGDTPLCTVATIERASDCKRFRGPDWTATKARAENIAEALRHYQQSQEGERVL